MKAFSTKWGRTSFDFITFEDYCLDLCLLQIVCSSETQEMIPLYVYILFGSSVALTLQHLCFLMHGSQKGLKIWLLPEKSLLVAYFLSLFLHRPFVRADTSANELVEWPLDGNLWFRPGDSVACFPSGWSRGSA